MTIFNLENSLLLIVDLQEKLVNASYNKDLIIKKSSILTSACKILNLPVFASEQYPKGLGNTIECLIKNIPSQNIFEKTDFNALKNENLKQAVLNEGCKQIILCGIETHICLYQTAMNLKEMGYDVTIISDCSGSRAELEHLSALQELRSNNISIKTTEMILFELLKTAKHEKFKEVQALIK